MRENSREGHRAVGWKDEIVEEVRRIREEYAAQFGYDIAAIVRDAQKQEKQSGREVVRLPPRRPQILGTERSKTEVV